MATKAPNGSNTGNSKPDIMKDQLYAVITGDIAKSSRFEGEARRKLLTVVKGAFSKVESILGTESIAFPFEVFRGDSFQGVLIQAEKALTAAVLIRAFIRSSYKTTLKNAVDARIAVGIGAISHLPDKNSGEGDGDAYRNSGPELDKMSKHARMTIIKTPWDQINEELNVECAMLDVIISRWTVEQADVVLEFFNGKTQDEMAAALNISQPAIKKRVASANIFQLELMINRFNKIIIDEHYNPVGL